MIKPCYDLVVGAREHAMRDGALPARIKSLMIMLSDELNHRRDAVPALANVARGQGATEEEVTETAEVAFWIGGIHAFNCAAEAFRK